MEGLSIRPSPYNAASEHSGHGSQAGTIGKSLTVSREFWEVNSMASTPHCSHSVRSPTAVLVALPDDLTGRVQTSHADVTLG